MKFKVFNLNCWGLRYLSKHRSCRLKAIGQFLSENDFDFVFLQEVWVKSDYNYLVNTLKKKLPYSKRFTYGIIGSGLCIFSNKEIINSFFVPFTDNGYFYRLKEADWFAGKGYGICQVVVNNIVLNLCVTHFCIDSKHCNYYGHKILQALSLSNFIKFLSNDSNAFIIAGDFNSTPDSLIMRLFRLVSDTQDAYCDSKNYYCHCSHLIDDNPIRNNYSTYLSPLNSFTRAMDKKINFDGLRLDYILYKYTSNSQVLRCNDFFKPLPNVVTEKLKISFSDHEGIAASFEFVNINDLLETVAISNTFPNQKSSSNDSIFCPKDVLKCTSNSAIDVLNEDSFVVTIDKKKKSDVYCLKQTIQILKNNLKKCDKLKVFYHTIGTITFITSWILVFVGTISYSVDIFLNVIQLLMVIFSFLIGVIIPLNMRREINSLKMGLQTIYSG